MKTLAILAFLGASTFLHAQSMPDCRAPNLPLGSLCKFDGTTLPTQKYFGDISLPPSDHVRMTGPLMPNPVTPPVVVNVHSFSAGAMFTVQTETLGFKRYVSSGGKGFVGKQWSDWRGVEVRGTAIETSLGGLGVDAGNNHTVAITAGPRIQHTYGRVAPYGEILVGFIHQYYYGMSESGVFGASVRINERFSIIPADVEYRYASFQNSTAAANPRRGRIELSTGIVYKFGK